MSEPELSTSTVHLQLRRILDSRTFARAGYLARFLKRCVEETLAGNSGQLKEFWLGTVVFGREDNFNPAGDPIVRVQARRLREKLTLYYQTEGLLDPVRISLPIGSYVPIFSTMNRRKWPEVYGGRPWALAVLPLTPIDLTSDSIRFADTMTAELTHALVEAGGLEVVSRTSTWGFRGPAQDIRAIGRSLNADFIVEGCVCLADSHHRIILQLTGAETGYHCWSAWFEHRNTRMEPDARRIAAMLRDELPASVMSRPHLAPASAAFAS